MRRPWTMSTPNLSDKFYLRAAAKQVRVGGSGWDPPRPSRPPGQDPHGPQEHTGKQRGPPETHIYRDPPPDENKEPWGRECDRAVDGNHNRKRPPTPVFGARRKSGNGVQTEHNRRSRDRETAPECDQTAPIKRREPGGTKVQLAVRKQQHT